MKPYMMALNPLAKDLKPEQAMAFIDHKWMVTSLLLSQKSWWQKHLMMKKTHDASWSLLGL